jgi:hypothetical protein
MRRLFALFLFAFALTAHAQQPAKLEPLPEPPAPPPGMEAVDEPQVTIVKRGADTVEEYRINGKLYMVKVTPPHGVPYYLVDERGDGQFTRQDNLDSGVRVPRWVIFRF